MPHRESLPPTLIRRDMRDWSEARSAPALANGPPNIEFLDGFHDRSHFNKEFRSFVAVPPTALMKASRSSTSISDALLHRELATG